MGDAGNITGWIVLFVGLYSVAAGAGEFRRPGFWARMVRETRRSNAIQFLIGMVTLVIGATIYLVNPFDPGDWLSILITVLGGWIIVEGLLILAVPDLFLGFAQNMMNGPNRIWAGLSILIGVAAIFIGIIRLQMAG